MEPNEDSSPKELIQPEPPVQNAPIQGNASKTEQAPETEPSSKNEIETKLVSQSQTIGPAPVEVVKPAPVATPFAVPPWTEERIRAEKLTHCPVCGSGPHDRVDLHFRWKHKDRPPGNPTGKGGFTKGNKAAIKSAVNGSETGPVSEPSSQPDFSDITGEQQAQPRFDTQSVPLAPLGPNYGQMAEMSFNMTTGLLSQIFGPEWQPRNEEEKKMVVGATEAYFKSVELPDIPPGYVLCFVCLAYAAPRLNAQPTKTKMQQLFLWFKSKFSRKRNNVIQLPKPAEPAATPPTSKPEYP